MYDVETDAKIRRILKTQIARARKVVESLQRAEKGQE